MINKTFLDLKTDIGNNVRDTSSSSLSIFGGFINEAYEEFLRRANYQNLVDDYSFTTTPGTADYVLPDDFYKELYVLDTTNDMSFGKTDIQRFAQDYPSSVNVTGNSQAYTILRRPVRTQPTAAGVITVVSSSALDTAQEVFVRGYLNGVEATETLSLNGTSTVTSTLTFDRVAKISKSDTTYGNVTVSAGSVTLGILSRRSKDYSVSILRLFEAPNSAIVLSVPYYTDFISMTDNNEVPVVNCGDYLVARGTAKAWKYKRQFSKAAIYDAEAERLWDEYLWQQENDPNKPHQFRPVGYSRDIY
jgi:hypothetical protein